jgi:hypothetical protein
MSVRCGHCKDGHDTVAQVRLCAERSRRQTDLADRPDPSPQPEWQRQVEAQRAEQLALIDRNRQARADYRAKQEAKGVRFEVTEAGIQREIHPDGRVYRTQADIDCSPEHPCDGKNYHRCNRHRAQDAAFSGNWRDRFRAYND